MKFRNRLALLLAVVMTMTAASFTFTAHADEVKDNVFPYYQLQKGTTDKRETATVDTVNDPEKGQVLKIVPMPDGEDNTRQIIIDGWGAQSFNIDMTKYQYIAVDYYLHMDSVNAIYANMNILPHDILQKGMSARSTDPLIHDTWSTMYFVFKDGASLVIDKDNPYVKQIHFKPFGEAVKPAEMKETDYILIGNVTCSAKNPLEGREYEVSFSAGRDDAVGTAPNPYKVGYGETINLPAVPFTCEGKTASGWIPSTGSKIYAPLSDFVMPNSDVRFTVYWGEKSDLEEAVEPITIQLSDYVTGSADNRTNAIVTKGVEYEGHDNVIKVVPQPKSDTKDKIVILDGWSYGGAKIDANKYGTLLVVYKYESEKPFKGQPSLNIMARDTFKKIVELLSMDPVVTGRWATASYSLDKAKEQAVEEVDAILKQVHIRCFGAYNQAQVLDENDVMYIDKLIAIPESATGSAYHESFIKGYDDGTFGVAGNMTRAEACTIVARLVAGSDELVPTGNTSAFSDVTAGDWFQKYIAYCEKLGFLKAYSGAFLPNQNITRAEFVELVYNMGLLSDNEKNGVFTDVAADHPRYNVITAAGKAGLVNGYDNGDGTFCFKPDNTITRAEVVKVINNAYGKKCSADGIFEGAKSYFSDVDESHWAYADILDAAIGHISILDADGKEVWISALGGDFANEDFTPDYEAGEKFLRDTEAKIEARRAEIRATASDYKEATGKKWYVSNKGSDSNDGASEQTPVATIAKAHQLASVGDAILLERGGEWKGNWAAKSGIVYSAYGEGPKPFINGSTEDNATGAGNWTLVSGTNNVYKYKKALRDVGSIIYNNGEKLAEKLCPNVKDGTLLLNDKPVDPKTSLTKNNTFVCVYQNITADGGNAASVDADIYVRCDEGNPGEIYDSIILATKNNAIGGASGCVFDNLCIKYAGVHGIGGLGGTSNVTVRNCEIGWIGGCMSGYSKSGSLVRLGNGVEVYGSCDGYHIDNCYVYQCYDAGVTHQVSAGGTPYTQKDVSYTNNLIEKCIYNIEYFMGKPDNDIVRLMQDISIKNNILSESGRGWGADPSRSAGIKSWESYNRAENFTIEGNTFFMDYGMACEVGTLLQTWMPVFRNNTYCQYYGHTLTKVGANGATLYSMLGSTPDKLAKSVGETGATFYYVKPGTTLN